MRKDEKMIGFALCKDLGWDLDHYLDSPGYAIERKYDGDRVHVEVTDGKVKIYNRSMSNYTYRLPEIVEAVRLLGRDMVLDGEVCFFDVDGREDFNMARRRCGTDNKLRVDILSRKYLVTVKVFDLLRLDGESCTGMSYLMRKSLLCELLRSGDRLSYVEHYIDNKRDIWDRSKQENWEGIILKKLINVYSNGRSDNFIRVKHFKEKTIKFNGYEFNPAGITLTNDEGIRVQCAGNQSKQVKELIDKQGYADVEIQYLQGTDKGKYRMPTFRGLKNSRKI